MTSEQRLDRLERIAKLFVKAGLRARQQSREQNAKINIILDAQIQNGERFRQIAEFQQQTDRRFQELADSHLHTDRRLDALIDIVRGSQNGKKKQDQDRKQ